MQIHVEYQMATNESLLTVSVWTEYRIWKEVMDKGAENFCFWFKLRLFHKQIYKQSLFEFEQNTRTETNVPFLELLDLPSFKSCLW